MVEIDSPLQQSGGRWEAPTVGEFLFCSVQVHNAGGVLCLRFIICCIFRDLIFFPPFQGKYNLYISNRIDA